MLPLSENFKIHQRFHGSSEGEVSLTEEKKIDNSNDMEFWYDVFMKAGSSIPLEENLDGRVDD